MRRTTEKVVQNLYSELESQQLTRNLSIKFKTMIQKPQSADRNLNFSNTYQTNLLIPIYQTNHFGDTDGVQCVGVQFCVLLLLPGHFEHAAEGAKFLLGQLLNIEEKFPVVT